MTGSLFLLTPTQVLCRLTVVEDVDQQTAAVLHDADIAAESGIRKAVHTSLHQDVRTWQHQAQVHIMHIKRLRSSSIAESESSSLDFCL